MARKRYHKPRRSHIVTPVPSENRIRTERTSDPNNKAAEQIREGAPAIWVKKGNGTTGPVSAQTLSMSQLLRWKWKSVKPMLQRKMAYSVVPEAAV